MSNTNDRVRRLEWYLDATRKRYNAEREGRLKALGEKAELIKELDNVRELASLRLAEVSRLRMELHEERTIIKALRRANTRGREARERQYEEMTAEINRLRRSRNLERIRGDRWRRACVLATGLCVVQAVWLFVIAMAG